MSWPRKVEESAKSSQIVILDNKNIPHGIFRDLQRKGLPIHIFAATAEGTHQHNPVIKGGNYSVEHRDGEIASIIDLNKHRGVAAIIVVSDGIYSNRDELIRATARLQQHIPGVKLVWLGSNPCDGADVAVEDYNATDIVEKKLRELLPQLGAARQ